MNSHWTTWQYPIPTGFFFGVAQHSGRYFKLSISRRNSFVVSAGVLDCVRHAGKKMRLSGDRNKMAIEINDLLNDVHQSIAKALAGKIRRK